MTGRLRLDEPVSLVLGGGGVRGMAHLGVLETLRERGVRVAEIVGTSVGALILVYHAAVGLDVDALKRIGQTMTSRQLLAWGLLRRAPEPIRARLRSRAGRIPEYLEMLERASWDRLHHGVERIGVVAYEASSRSELRCSGLDGVQLADATRGAAAMPFVFPPHRCLAGGRPLTLVDGGVVNCLPVDALFDAPFRPRQVIAVDISNREDRRRENLAKVDVLRAAHPGVPIEVLSPDTIGLSTILYRTSGLGGIVESGRQAARTLLDRA